MASPGARYYCVGRSIVRTALKYLPNCRIVFIVYCITCWVEACIYVHRPSGDGIIGFVDFECMKI